MYKEPDLDIGDVGAYAGYYRELNKSRPSQETKPCVKCGTPIEYHTDHTLCPKCAGN